MYIKNCIGLKDKKYVSIIFRRIKKIIILTSLIHKRKNFQLKSNGLNL